MLKKSIAGIALVAVIGLVATAAYALGTGSPVAEDAPIVASAPSGPSEGVQVHGQWTIEVADPNGNVVSTQDFENALVVNGAQFLSDLLTRQTTPGYWQISLATLVGSPGACLLTNGTPAGCRIVELPESHALVQAAADMYGDLSVTSPNSGTNERAVVLTETAIATNDGTIGRVSTNTHACDPTVAASASATCNSGSVVFTLKTLDTPVDVLNGQTINVTVVISFS